MPPKPTKSKNKPADDSPEVLSDSNDNESASFVTISHFEKLLNDQQKKTEACIKKTIKSELASLTQEIVRLQSELEVVSSVANNALKLSESLKKDVTLLQEENANMRAKLQNVIKEQVDIQEVVEENKNRQLRKTLIFKGIPEQKFPDQSNTNSNGSQRMNPESWDDTATILATVMSETLDKTVEQARAMVERCHRGAPNPRYKGNAPRPIFAAFVDWRDSELVKVAFRKHNLNARNTANETAAVYVEQKVGPRTTIRRNIAMKERKRLIATESIFNGYVSHPARLMVKDSRAIGAKYKLYRDYSKEPVNFER